MTEFTKEEIRKALETASFHIEEAIRYMEWAASEMNLNDLPAHVLMNFRSSELLRNTLRSLKHECDVAVEFKELKGSRE